MYARFPTYDGCRPAEKLVLCFEEKPFAAIRVRLRDETYFALLFCDLRGTSRRSNAIFIILSQTNLARGEKKLTNRGIVHGRRDICQWFGRLGSAANRVAKGDAGTRNKLKVHREYQARRTKMSAITFLRNFLPPPTSGGCPLFRGRFPVSLVLQSRNFGEFA